MEEEQGGEGTREGAVPPGGTGQCGRALSAQKLIHTYTNCNITRLGHAPGGKAQVMFVIWQGEHFLTRPGEKT